MPEVKGTMCAKLAAPSKHVFAIHILLSFPGNSMTEPTILDFNGVIPAGPPLR
ncbi:hypothetical protein [Planctopirus hydrillae]|uniref:hypothetical protein n=1 Tax=Planctopirus hydrillae TaxID=1841610 RepID=UPI0013F4E1A7|nr:hypothetical protein [Planctopirus hydrillae]